MEAKIGVDLVSGAVAETGTETELEIENCFEGMLLICDEVDSWRETAILFVFGFWFNPLFDIPSAEEETRPDG